MDDHSTDLNKGSLGCILVLLLVFGCIDEYSPIEQADVYGCTDDTACNFNANANNDDGNCYYAEDWEDECGICDLNPSNDCVQDECGAWGGDGVDEDGDGICDNEDDCMFCDNVRGYVLDASNNPINNANIYMTYDIPLFGDRPSTTFSFSIATTSNITIWIEDECEDTINVLINNEIMNAGNYSVTWSLDDSSGKKILDGRYFIMITDGTSFFEESVLFFSIIDGYEGCDLEDYPDGCRTIATTNSDGYFEFSLDCLSFGYSYMSFDEFGNEIDMYTIPHSLRLFIESEEGNKLTDLFEVDIVNGAEITINLDD